MSRDFREFVDEMKSGMSLWGRFKFWVGYRRARHEYLRRKSWEIPS